MEHAIIIDTDISFARQLRQVLSQQRQLKVTVMPTAEDAQSAIMRQPQDWAFVPLENACATAVALQSVQPDIRVIMVLPEPDVAITDECAQVVNGAIAKTRIIEDLATVLETAVAGKPLKATPHAPETAVIIAALQRIELDRAISAVVMGQASNYLAHWGDYSNMQARNVASFVGTEWVEIKSRTRLQFLYIEERATDVMLYTRHIIDDYFVTLIASPEASLVELRRQSDHLVDALNTILHGGQLNLDESNGTFYEANGHNSFALVWRPVRLMHPNAQSKLISALERLAEANGCVLTHTDVQPEYIHIVVTCPPGRDSTWAATLFKNGSEMTLQQKFKVTTAIWEKGFYATDSTRPLGPSELKLFLAE